MVIEMQLVVGYNCFHNLNTFFDIFITIREHIIQTPLKNKKNILTASKRIQISFACMFKTGLSYVFHQTCVNFSSATIIIIILNPV